MFHREERRPLCVSCKKYTKQKVRSVRTPCISFAYSTAIDALNSELLLAVTTRDRLGRTFAHVATTLMIEYRFAVWTINMTIVDVNLYAMQP
jgi:hypothetical protein